MREDGEASGKSLVVLVRISENQVLPITRATFCLIVVIDNENPLLLMEK